MRILLGVALCALIFSTMPAARADSSNPKIKVVATISIIGDWVKNVGGDEVDLSTLVGPDGDPHEYEPTPADNMKLQQAKIIFENGLGLEHWLDKLYAGSAASAQRVVLTKNIEARHVSNSEGERPNGKDDDRDPHAWQNVKLAKTMVADISDALASADPSHAKNYKSRAAAYLSQLDQLDNSIQQQINSLPPARRKLVTSHDAFGYFGQRYGMEISRSVLESVTTEASDPSARQMAQVIRDIRQSGVPVIFLENIQNPKLINQIAYEAGVKVGPDLYSDALGASGTDGDTYIKMMRHNVNVLVEALKP